MRNRRRPAELVCSIGLAIAGLGLMAVAAPPLSHDDRVLFNEMQTRNAEEERARLILIATVQGTSDIGADSAQVTAWRDRLLSHTDPFALASTAHPAFILDTCRNEGVDILFAANLIVDVWETVDRAAIESVRPESFGTINVAPPVETGLPPGVSPDAIHDPELRQQYLDAIIENRDRLYLHGRANQLDSASRDYAKRATRVITSLIESINEPSRDELRAKIQNAKLKRSEDLLEKFDDL